MTTLWQDARYGVRMMIRNPWFTIVAVVTLALGIGANTAIFSVINGLLLRSAPFPKAKQLVWIMNQEKGGPSAITSRVFTFRDLRRGSISFSDMAAYNAFFQYFTYNLTGAGEPERLSGVDISETFFPVLGVKPVLGRLFLPEESIRGGRQAIILSNGFWKARLGGRREVVGQTLTINGEPMTVVGVLPDTFDFGSIFAPGAHVDFFLPYYIDTETDSIGDEAAIVGRLKPGVTLASAQPELTTLAAEIKRLRGPAFRAALDAHGQLLENHVTGSLRLPLIVLACAVVFVLLIACANLSNLLLARAAMRGKEIALRLAVGANRLRLVRQMITESVILSMAGGFLGIPLAYFGTRALSSMRRTTVPMLNQVQIDFSALLFTLLVSALAGILFGLVPAFTASRSTVGNVIKESAGAGGPIHRDWSRGILIVSEVALSLIMLGGAGLMIKSLVRLLQTDLGFRPERIAVVRADPGSQIVSAKEATRFLDRVVMSVKAIPGVEDASVTDALPLDRDRSWALPRNDSNQQTLRAFVRFIGPNYFSVMKIALTKGRTFDGRDNADGPKVTVINETMARTLFPGRDPVGQLVTLNSGNRRVIGVVGDVKHTAIDQPAGLELYVPYSQGRDGLGGIVGPDLVIRTSLEPASLGTLLQRTIRSFAPDQPLSEFRTMEQIVETAASPRRFIAGLLSLFAGLALLLAAVGIYGVISYSVSQRTREMGIRTALGANAGMLQRQVIREAFILTVAGTGLGLLGFWALARYLGSLLSGASTQDPGVLSAAVAVLIGAALLAAWIPARRAARIDPALALRCE